MCHRYYLKKCFKKFVFFEQIFKKFYKFCRSNVNVERVYNLFLFNRLNLILVSPFRYIYL